MTNTENGIPRFFSTSQKFEIKNYAPNFDYYNSFEHLRVPNPFFFPARAFPIQFATKKSKSFFVNDILSPSFGSANPHKSGPSLAGLRPEKQHRFLSDTATVSPAEDGGLPRSTKFEQIIKSDDSLANDKCLQVRGDEVKNDLREFKRNRKRYYSGDSETEIKRKFPRYFQNSGEVNSIDCLRKLSASIGDDALLPKIMPLNLKKEIFFDYPDTKLLNLQDNSRSRSSSSAHSSFSSNQTPPIVINYVNRSNLTPPSNDNMDYKSHKTANFSNSNKQLNASIRNSENQRNKPDKKKPGFENFTNDANKPSLTSPITKNYKEGDSNNDQRGKFWPAWVYCTRYSDRPSSGPRSRKPKRQDSKLAMSESNPVSPPPLTDDKRPRTAFNSTQLGVLRREFDSCQYLTEERRNQLASSLGLQEYQVKIWFQNKRAKLKKTRGVRNRLALELMAQGLYNHSTSEKDQNSS